MSALTAALNTPADRPAIPATFPVTSSTSATATPPVRVGGTDADPAFADLATIGGAAASDALFADPGKDGWGEGLGDDLARALSP